MNGAGRVIKGGAVALAIFVICIVVSAICAAGIGVGRLIGLWDSWQWRENPGEMAEMEGGAWSDWTPEQAERYLKVLEIDVKTASVRFVEGPELRVETNNPRMTQKFENGKLRLVEESFSFWDDDWESELLIYWPNNLKLERVEISSGAAQLRIGKLEAEEAKFDLGAGRVEIAELKASREAKVSGGAGVLEILDGQINNLDLDMGVGRTMINAGLTGRNKIDAGLGKLEIGLKGDPDSYTLRVDKGLGSIRLDGRNLEDDQTYGNGPTLLEIDGGVGAIEINYR